MQLQLTNIGYPRTYGEVKILHTLVCSSMCCKVHFFENPIEGKEEIIKKYRCTICQSELVDWDEWMPF